MKEKKSELIFIIDKSGSMSGLEKDTIGGFNSLINKQKNEKGQALITLVLFDDNIEYLYSRVELEKVKELSSKDYVPCGCTALLDAIGNCINKISSERKQKEENEIIDNTLVVITTDGLENASREYNYKMIKNLINKKKEEKWEFLFLGANIDSEEIASNIGIDKERSVNYNCDEEGIKLNYQCINEAVSTMRACGSLDSSWRKEIDEDIKKRKVR